jgi:hypothetical protein
MALRPSATLARAIQSWVARVAVGPSTIRGYPKGTVEVARRFLRELRLRRFSNDDATRFGKELDRVTLELLAALPRRARRWGLARKMLNLYLRDCVYNAHLRAEYRLGRLEGYCELPLDSVTAMQLRRVTHGRNLPRWPGVGALHPGVSAQYQAAATQVARARRVRRVHLDVFWWSEERDDR